MANTVYRELNAGIRAAYDQYQLKFVNGPKTSHSPPHHNKRHCDVGVSKALRALKSDWVPVRRYSSFASATDAGGRMPAGFRPSLPPDGRGRGQTKVMSKGLQSAMTYFWQREVPRQSENSRTLKKICAETLQVRPHYRDAASRLPSTNAGSSRRLAIKCVWRCSASCSRVCVPLVTPTTSRQPAAEPS